MYMYMYSICIYIYIYIHTYIYIYIYMSAKYPVAAAGGPPIEEGDRVHRDF